MRFIINSSKKIGHGEGVENMATNKATTESFNIKTHIFKMYKKQTRHNDTSHNLYYATYHDNMALLSLKIEVMMCTCPIWCQQNKTRLRESVTKVDNVSNFVPENCRQGQKNLLQ